MRSVATVIKSNRNRWICGAFLLGGCALLVLTGCGYRKTAEDLKKEATIAELTAVLKDPSPDCVAGQKPHPCTLDELVDINQLLSLTITNLTFSYQDREMWAEAEPLLRTEIARSGRANDYMLLGFNLDRQKKSNEAVETFKEGARVCQAKFDRDSESMTPLKVASALRQLADLYAASKQLPAAEERYRRALDIYSTEKGPNSEEVELTTHSYADMLLRVPGREAEWTALIERSQAIHKQRMGKP